MQIFKKKHDTDKDPSARKCSFSESACAIKLLSIHLTNSSPPLFFFSTGNKI